MDSPPGDVTALLSRLAAGDRSVEEELLPLVYGELHKLALAKLSRERAGHTLQATALVHEAYLRLCGKQAAHFQNRAHFWTLAARIMRRILIDYARQRNAEKRGFGNAAPLAENLDGLHTEDQLTTALEVDEALGKLAALSPRQAQVVEMRFFGGLSIEEIAESLAIHPRTVKRDWLAARAWLHEQLRSK